MTTKTEYLPMYFLDFNIVIEVKTTTFKDNIKLAIIRLFTVKKGENYINRDSLSTFKDAIGIFNTKIDRIILRLSKKGVTGIYEA